MAKTLTQILKEGEIQGLTSTQKRQLGSYVAREVRATHPDFKPKLVNESIYLGRGKKLKVPVISYPDQYLGTVYGCVVEFLENALKKS